MQAKHAGQPPANKYLFIQPLPSGGRCHPRWKGRTARAVAWRVASCGGLVLRSSGSARRVRAPCCGRGAPGAATASSVAPDQRTALDQAAGLAAALKAGKRAGVAAAQREAESELQGQRRGLAMQGGAEHSEATHAKRRLSVFRSGNQRVRFVVSGPRFSDKSGPSRSRVVCRTTKLRRAAPLGRAQQRRALPTVAVSLRTSKLP